MKNFLQRHTVLSLVIGLGLLLLTQQKIILPLVYEVVKSDAFLVESKDEASQLPISNQTSDAAFLHCNTHVKEKYSDKATLEFPAHALNSWTLGNYQYSINAEITAVNKENNSSKTLKYACRIIYDKGEDQTDINNIDSWSLVGISGLNDL